jgi:hypothetical protein
MKWIVSTSLRLRVAVVVLTAILLIAGTLGDRADRKCPQRSFLAR